MLQGEKCHFVGNTNTISTGGDTFKDCKSPAVLHTVSVVGAVLALIVAITISYASGLLTGLLVRRKKNHTLSASGDISSPMYDQVLPVTTRSIPLKENEAYGRHLVS